MNETPIALVTGAARGIGYACAEAIAESGARMVLADINGDGVIAAAESLGNEAAGIACDVRDPASVAEALTRVGDELGVPDILVNNAAGNFLCPSEELSPNAFAAVVNIVLNGTWHCTHALARRWIDGGTLDRSLIFKFTYLWTL